MIVRARVLASMAGVPIFDGAAVVEDGYIQAVGRFDDLFAQEKARLPLGEQPHLADLGDQVLLPGLINAHCHLDYTSLKNAIAPQRSFTQWILRINALKRQMSDEDILESIILGFTELKRWGTTSVFNLEAFPELLPRLPKPPLRVWWFLELIDIRKRIETEALMSGILAFFEGREGWLGGYGLNPHSPYTASPELYRLCAGAAKRFRMPLSTHLAESAEEEAMFHHASGELYEFLQGIGRQMDDCGKGSSFSNAVKQGLVDPSWIIAHANELDNDDLALMASQQNKGAWSIVHCPRSHAFFKHRPFPWVDLQALGVNVCLGTDSLASNDSLSLFAEMQAAKKSAPWLTSEQLVETVTTRPAQALNKSGKLGVIAPGAHADMIALPFEGPVSGVYDAIVNHSSPIKWMMLDGKCI